MRKNDFKIYGIIYLIKNKINNKIYIGQTTNTFKGRYCYNLSNHTHNSYLKKSIQKYGIENFYIDEKFDIAYSKEELDKLECLYIDIYKTTNKKYGYNIKSGGSFGKHSEETKKRISESHLGEKNSASRKIICLNNLKTFSTIKEASDYFKIKPSNISQCVIKRQRYTKDKNNNKIFFMYYEEYQNISKIEINNIMSDNKQLRKNSNIFKKVVCLNTKKIFNSVSEACEYYNINRSNLANCCKGNVNYCGVSEEGHKLVWRYYDDYINMKETDIDKIINSINKYTKNHFTQKVICLNTGKIYNSIKEACIDVGLSITNRDIGQVCIGKRKYAGKINGEYLKWKYYE